MPVDMQSILKEDKKESKKLENLEKLKSSLSETMQVNRAYTVKEMRNFIGECLGTYKPSFLEILIYLGFPVHSNYIGDGSMLKIYCINRLTEDGFLKKGELINKPVWNTDTYFYLNTQKSGL